MTNSDTGPGALVALVLIAIGGFVGANLRYLVDLLLPTSLVATLTVNVIGCAIFGFLLYENRYAGTISRQGYLVLATGFTSSFTTYSTFIVDALRSAPPIALGYVFASYALGFAAVLLGRWGADRFAGRQPPGREDVDATNERLIKE